MDKEILIIDRDEALGSFLKESRWFKGYRITQRQKLSSGLQALNGGRQIVLLGKGLPDSAGYGGLSEIRTFHPDAVVILMTESAETKEMSKLLHMGAFHCIAKPVDEDYLSAVVICAGRHMETAEEIKRLKADAVREPDVIFKSASMYKTLHKLHRASEDDNPVLIIGEEGTGRQMCAKVIHYRSKRNTMPFVNFNASSDTNVSVLEEKRNFASGGTLFIKDIDLLQDECLSLIASFSAGVPRVVASASSSDGFDGWNVIEIPPLRKRAEDILPLARHFLDECALIFMKNQKILSKEAERHIKSYQWTGNVREMKSILRQAFIYTKGDVIETKDLFLEGAGTIKDFLDARLRKFMKGFSEVGRSNIYDTAVAELEKALIEIALEETGGNKLKAARVMGISRNTLSSKIKSLKIKS